VATLVKHHKAKWWWCAAVQPEEEDRVGGSWGRRLHAEKTYSTVYALSYRKGINLLVHEHNWSAGPNGLVWTGIERRLGPKGLPGLENGKKLIQEFWLLILSEFK
jgi:hypothetical protein